MRSCVRFAMLVAILCLSIPQLLVAQDAARPNYYPLKVGTKWYYRLDVNGQSIEVVNQVTKIDKVDGEDRATIDSAIQGMGKGSETLSTNDKGIFRHSMNGLNVKTPICILRYPVKNGDTWDGETEINGQTMKLKGKTGAEEVTVPAGKYQATTSHIETDFMGQKFTTTYYFVPEIGIVKQIMSLGDRKFFIELQRTEMGK